MAEPIPEDSFDVVELCSLHMHYGWDPEKVVANSLFADGAGALVAGGPAPDASPLQVLGSGSTLIPGSSDLMSWTIAAHLRPWLALAFGPGLSVEASLLG